MGYLAKRILRSSLKMEQVTIVQVIEEVEKRVGTDNCTISWAIDSKDEKLNVSFHAGISYMELLQFLSQSFGYVLLSAEEKSETGKPIIYLSLMKRLGV